MAAHAVVPAHIGASISLPVYDMARQRAYEKAIEALIPGASLAANDAIGRENTEKPEFAAAWNDAFHRALDLAAHAQGIRTASWIVEGARHAPR